MQGLEVRKELLEFGLLPIGLLLPGLDTLSAIIDLHLGLLASARRLDGREGIVDVGAVMHMLRLSSNLWRVLLDALEAVTAGPATFRQNDKPEAIAVDVHILSLFLVAQLYGKSAQRWDLSSAWPENIGMEMPSPRGSGVHQETAKHDTHRRLLAQQSILNFPSFLRRNIYALLCLAMDEAPPRASPLWTTAARTTSSSNPNPSKKGQEPKLWMTAAEVDRLGLFLKPEGSDINMNGAGNLGARASGISEWKKLSSWIPMYRGKQPGHVVSGEEIAAWLIANIADAPAAAEEPAESPEELEKSGHIRDLGKGTVVRGEDCFPGRHLLITDCKDACIYALAPLSLAKISSCTDCVIVVGAVAGVLHLEDSSRIHLVAACRRLYISSCYDCVLHLGTNRPPVFCGDNRFVQLAPYNTGYERLPLHLEIAGISRHNMWDQPSFLKSLRGSMDLDQAMHGGGSSAWKEGPERTGVDQIQAKKVLLPPDKLSPFTIPFRGGPGPLAGGAASGPSHGLQGRGSGGAAVNARQVSLPFALPSQYAEAMVKKLRKVAELQGSLGQAIVDTSNRRALQVAIQGYFKDWLFSSGRIRQVYDLAKLEQQALGEQTNSNSSSKSNAKPGRQ